MKILIIYYRQIILLNYMLYNKYLKYKFKWINQIQQDIQHDQLGGVYVRPEYITLISDFLSLIQSYKDLSEDFKNQSDDNYEIYNSTIIKKSTDINAKIQTLQKKIPVPDQSAVKQNIIEHEELKRKIIMCFDIYTKAKYICIIGERLIQLKNKISAIIKSKDGASSPSLTRLLSDMKNYLSQIKSIYNTYALLRESVFPEYKNFLNKTELYISSRLQMDYKSFFEYYTTYYNDLATKFDSTHVLNTFLFPLKKSIDKINELETKKFLNYLDYERIFTNIKSNNENINKLLKTESSYSLRKEYKEYKSLYDDTIQNKEKLFEMALCLKKMIEKIKLKKDKISTTFAKLDYTKYNFDEYPDLESIKNLYEDIEDKHNEFLMLLKKIKVYTKYDNFHKNTEKFIMDASSNIDLKQFIDTYKLFYEEKTTYIALLKEQIRQAEAERRRRQQEEAERRRQQEEAERRRQREEAERRRQREEAERRRQREEAERRRRQQEEAERRRQQEVNQEENKCTENNITNFYNVGITEQNNIIKDCHDFVSKNNTITNLNCEQIYGKNNFSNPATRHQKYKRLAVIFHPDKSLDKKIKELKYPIFHYITKCDSLKPILS